MFVPIQFIDMGLKSDISYTYANFGSNDSIFLFQTVGNKACEHSVFKNLKNYSCTYFGKNLKIDAFIPSMPFERCCRKPEITSIYMS